jgi:hypothetical protein
MPGLFSQSRGTVRTLQCLFCQVNDCSIVTRFAVLGAYYINLCIFHIILCKFTLFYVFIYIILCNFCHRVFTQLQFTNISISTHLKIFFFLIKPTDALISQIYFVKKLYMFRAIPLPIIRSFPLYIRHCVCHAGLMTAFKHD